MTSTHHPSLFPAVGFLLKDVEVALPRDDGAHPDLLTLRHIQHQTHVGTAQGTLQRVRQCSAWQLFGRGQPAHKFGTA